MPNNADSEKRIKGLKVILYNDNEYEPREAVNENNEGGQNAD